MFSLSPLKIMVIVAVALVLLGPDKLPEVAHKLGSSWRALRRIQERVESEVREVIPDLPSSAELVRIARSPVNMLNQLADRAEARDAQATEKAASGEQQGTEVPATTSEITPASEPVVQEITLPIRTEYAPLPPDPSLN